MHFREERWSDAVRLLEAAVRAGAGGEHVWRLLGTARYLAGDRDGALTAWNRIGAPVPEGGPEVLGARRTPADLYARAAGLPQRDPLSPADRVLAERRLAHLPALRTARVGWEPVSLDRARVRVVVSEERLLPSGWLEIGTRVVEAAFRDEARYTAGSPLRRGGALRASGRWRDGRRAGALVAGIPVGPGRRIVLHTAAGWREETATLAPAAGRPAGPEGPGGPAGGPASVVRASGAFLLAGAGGWLSPRVRWRADLRRDAWDEPAPSTGGAVELELRTLGQRLSLLGRAGLHRFESGGGGWESAEARVRLRSREEDEGGVLLAEGVWAAVGTRAPHPLWPGAGTGTAREPLLRAHPLLDGGTIVGAAFGRSLVRAGVEGRWWGLALGPLRAAPAAFVDAAAVWRTEDRAEGRWRVDAGLGLRVSLAGAEGTLRFDAATGLTDRAGAVSVGWSAPWPGHDPLALRRR